MIGACEKPEPLAGESPVNPFGNKDSSKLQMVWKMPMSPNLNRGWNHQTHSL